MKISDETAHKLLDLLIDERAEKWMAELDALASRLGMNPDDLRRELRPLIQNKLDKYFKV